MKLLYITNGICGSGGLERVLSVKVSALCEDYGYDIVIATLNENNHKPFYNFSPKIKFRTFVSSGNALLYALKYRSSIKKLVEDERPDIISVCDDGLKGFLIPRIIGKKIPVIYERHASQNIFLGQHNKSGIKKWLTLKSFDLMRFLSKDFQKFIVLTKGNLKEWPKNNNLMVIPNPLPFYPDEVSNLQNKQVIAVGKQSYQKAYDILLPIWKEVNNNENWQLHIYGKKYPELGLEDLKNNLQIQDSVFFHDAVKDVEDVYKKSSIFVLTSRFEGFAMVIIEAMSCGVPVISFDCPYGPGDIITDGTDGFLIDKGNEEKFAQKLELLMNDFELRQKMGSAGKESVKKYLPENIVKQWDELFKSLKDEFKYSSSIR